MPFIDFSNRTWQPQPYDSPIIAQVPASIRETLLDRASLTQRLKQIHNGDFFVQVIRHEWLEPTPSEQQFLNCYDPQASIREVILFGSGQPVVFARSVLPASSVKEENNELLRLGNRPLGEYIFNSPNLRRGPIEIAHLPAKQFNQHLNFDYHTETAWGRRSLFYVNEKPISVHEVLLPNLEPQ